MPNLIIHIISPLSAENQCTLIIPVASLTVDRLIEIHMDAIARVEEDMRENMREEMDVDMEEDVGDNMEVDKEDEIGDNMEVDIGDDMDVDGDVDGDVDVEMEVEMEVEGDT
jgi:hypothetical protein